MREDVMEWRSILDMIVKDAQPERIAAELPGMIEWAGGDVEGGISAMIGFTGQFLLESAGLAAAYVLPPEDPMTALAAVADCLQHLDFETGLDKLPKDQQRLVRKYIAAAKPLYADCGRVMQAVLGAYVRNDYDLAADPNALILEAERAMAQDSEAALRILGRVGAMGLRGKRWWWRWHREIAQPLSGWIGLALNLVADNSDEEKPLGPIEQERARWHRIEKETRERFAEELPPKPSEKTADELDPLLARLFAGEHALTRDLEKALAARREEAIPRLIEIAGDEQLWGSNSRGKGFAPIHAVKMLDKLRAREAVPTLIDVIADIEPMTILGDAAIFALESIGAPATPAILETVRYTRNRELKATLASILGKVGRDHPATFDALVTLFNELSWEDDRMFVAWGLGDLGDPRAIPLLQDALRSRGIGEQDQIEVEEVLRGLGAEPDTPQRLQPDITLSKPRARRPRQKDLPQRRTAPCWCGSGKQYSRCHMQADIARASKRKKKAK
jgi:hypothetical protein